MLTAAIGYSLPMAVGAALSPLPISAVVTILLSSKPTNATKFLIGWVIGILVIGLVVFVIPGLDSERGEPTTLSGWIRLLLGGAMLLLAIFQWWNRSSKKNSVKQPKALERLNSAGTGAALTSGFLLSLNPKNLVLVFAGSATIDSSLATPTQQLVALIVFAIVASITFIIPIIVYYLFPERSQLILASLKSWITQNSAHVLASLLTLFGVLVIWNGLSILAG
jgi:hypothetical protein